MVESNTNSTLPLPPGETGLPFLGETFKFLLDRNFAQKKQAKHGNIYKTNFFGGNTVVMIGADANRHLS